MGFYVRKSLKLGPHRLNFSKSGVGLSTGVTGAQFGVDARGKKYIHLGRGGLYYRTTLSDDLQAAGDAQSSGAGISWGVVLAILAALFVLYLLAN